MSKVERDCLRVLKASAPDGSLSASVSSCRPWASALFVGHRLTIAIQAHDDSWLDGWLVGLPDTELTWPGHFAASVDVIERGANAATIELLIVES